MKTVTHFVDGKHPDGVTERRCRCWEAKPSRRLSARPGMFAGACGAE